MTCRTGFHLIAATLAALWLSALPGCDSRPAQPDQPAVVETIPEIVFLEAAPRSIADEPATPSAARRRIDARAYAHFSRAVTWERKSRQAVMQLQEIIRQGNPQGLSQQQLEAYQKTSAEMWARSEMHLRTVMKLDPDADYVLAWWAENQYIRGQSIQALATLRKLADLSIDDFETAYRAAIIAAQLGPDTSEDVPDLVQRFYEKCLETPDSAERRQSIPIVYLQLSDMYVDQGRYRDAVKMLRRLLAIPREHFSASMDNERVYQRLNAPWQTRRIIARHLLTLHGQVQRMDRGATRLAEAASVLTDAPGPFGHTARLLAQLGRRLERADRLQALADEALAEIEKVRQSPEADDIQTALIEVRALVALEQYDKVVPLADTWIPRDPKLAVLFKALKVEALLASGKTVEGILAMAPGPDGGSREFDVVFNHALPVLDRLDVRLDPVRDSLIEHHGKALQDPYVQFTLGMLAYIHDDFETAEKHFRLALDIKRTLYRAAYMLAETLAETGRLGDAVELALDKSKIQSDWRVHLLGLLRRLPGQMAEKGKPFDAAAAWSRIVAAGKDYAEVALFQEGDIVRELLRRGPTDSVVRLLETRPELVKSNPGYNYLVGKVLAADARLPRAADFLRTANRLADQSGLLWDLTLLELSDVLVRMDRFDEALKVLDTMPPGKVLHGQAMQSRVWILLEQKKLPQALAAARKLVKDQPRDPRRHVLLATVTEKTDGYKQADLLLQKARTEQNFVGIDIPRARASLALQAKQYDVAVKLLETILERNDLTDDQRMRNREFLAHVLDERGDAVRAEALYRDNLATWPEDASVANSLSYFLAQQGRSLPEAERLVKRSLEQDPKNYAYLDTLGWVYYKMGRLDEAIDLLAEAARLRDDAVILDHLGDAYRKAGRLDEAIDAYTRAVAQDDATDEMKKKLDQLKDQARRTDDRPRATNP